LRFIALVKKIGLITLLSFIIIGCGGDTASNEDSKSSSESINKSEYKGLRFYYKNLPVNSYKLKQLSDDDFNALSSEQKLLVADKLLSTLFFGYKLKSLEEKINNGDFLKNIRINLDKDSTDKEWLENYILDSEKFYQYNTYNTPQAITILSRFYAMKKLDKYFLHNWIAYILTQTIMFSPAYELESTHIPNKLFVIADN